MPAPLCIVSQYILLLWVCNDLTPEVTTHQSSLYTLHKHSITHVHKQNPHHTGPPQSDCIAEHEGRML